MKTLLLITIFCIPLSGCASYTYYHPEKSQSDLDRDSFICEEYAETKYYRCKGAGSYYCPQAEWLNDCLKRRFGWQVTVDY